MTIRDIARLAGVSIATVSRVLNNRCVSNNTREKILAIIQRYEYCPNSFAQYLGQRSKARSRRKNVTVYSKS